MSKTDGGPAFPGDAFAEELFKALRPEYGINEAKRMASVRSPGMSLRDWFAGQALAGWAPRHFVPDTPRDIAEACGKLADAMLKERTHD